MRSARKKNQDKTEIIYTVQVNFAIPIRAIVNVATEYNLHRFWFFGFVVCFFFLINHIIFHVSFRGKQNNN